MDHFYKQPKYFRNFKCIGGDCPKSCCDGWNVGWKNEELEKLRNSDCSTELKDKINNSFKMNDEKNCYVVNMCEDGRCPFHNRETDLCDIQKEIGERYLGIVCSRYPRQYIEREPLIFRWCVGSCPAVLDLLIENEDAAEVENILCRDYKKLNRENFKIDDINAMRLAPIKVYRFNLFDLYMELLFEKNRSFENSMILTALAAKHISDAENSGKYKSIPQIILDLKPQLSNPGISTSLDDIKPNYQLKFKLINNMVVKFFEDRPEIVGIISSIHNGEELIMEKYIEGLEKFKSAFGNRDYILRNISMNLFFDLEMPIGKIGRSLFDNYAFFVLAVATVKAMAAAIGFNGNNIGEEFKLCVAELCRSFAHNPIKAGYMIDEIKGLGLTTPAHLALIIKG